MSSNARFLASSTVIFISMSVFSPIKWMARDFVLFFKKVYFTNML